MLSLLSRGCSCERPDGMQGQTMIISLRLYKCDMKVNLARKRKLGRPVQDKYKCFDVMIDC